MATSSETSFSSKENANEAAITAGAAYAAPYLPKTTEEKRLGELRKRRMSAEQNEETERENQEEPQKISKDIERKIPIKIGFVESWIIGGFALFFDFLDLIFILAMVGFAVIPVIGEGAMFALEMLGDMLDIWIWIIIILWALFRGIKFSILLISLLALLEFIPGVEIIPTWTGIIFFIVRWQNRYHNLAVARYQKTMAEVAKEKKR